MLERNFARPAVCVHVGGACDCFIAHAAVNDGARHAVAVGVFGVRGLAIYHARARVAPVIYFSECESRWNYKFSFIAVYTFAGFVEHCLNCKCLTARSISTCNAWRGRPSAPFTRLLVGIPVLHQQRALVLRAVRWRECDEELVKRRGTAGVAECKLHCQHTCVDQLEWELEEALVEARVNGAAQ